MQNTVIIAKSQYACKQFDMGTCPTNHKYVQYSYSEIGCDTLYVTGLVKTRHVSTNYTLSHNSAVEHAAKPYRWVDFFNQHFP